MKIKPSFYNLDAKSGRQNKESFQSQSIHKCCDDSPKQTVKPS